MVPRIRPVRQRGNTRAGLSSFVAASALAGVLVAGLLLPFASAAGLAAKQGAEYYNSLPAGLPEQELSQRSVLLAADGSPLAAFYEQNRIVVPLAKIAPVMQRAMLAVEDARFYQHGPVDPKAVIRALVQNLKAGDVEQGASSLTQQYVKNMLIQTAHGDQKKIKEATAPTLKRKIQELKYAAEVEKRLTKDQILEAYLNIAYFGDGVYGVEAAARHYFRKSAALLTLPEAALIAGLVRQPGMYDPTHAPQAARSRRNTVLDRMAAVGFITSAEAARAKQAPLGLDVVPMGNGCERSKAPFFCEYALSVILSDPVFGKTARERRDLLLRGGLRIQTTLDPRAQEAAQRAIDARIEPDNEVAMALAMVQPGTGAVKAIATNRRFGNGRGQTKVNLAVDKRDGGSSGFQAGSTFKPFVLATAIKQGVPVTKTFNAPPAITLSGFRFCDSGRRYPPWAVSNYEGLGYGAIDMRVATWRSVNTYFAQLEQLTTQCEAVKTAHLLGVRRADGRPLETVPSFVLGSQEVSPLAMAEAYATFAARGVHCESRPISAVIDRNGSKLPIPPPKCRWVLDPRVADTVNSVLAGVIDGPDRQRTGGRLTLGRPAAGKTGTTDSTVAVWFVGYTPDLSTAVWTGYPDRSRPMRSLVLRGKHYPRVSGARVPGPVWQEAMKGALADTPPRPFGR
ncbi:Multimodular transpeptidase-transglycosylase [Carbonactinospora thermoautotrophica]|uniref:Multimodular transpeptidase-transglycosylase n=1 Tax=Carbonactinospora thermoautotrophica TaxID=1469144 RepID=A0A132MM59_9ACTN|nr:transglycosylase domain-containing protein [Carbonactinospora thermoautotrophica]KWW98947.1 Multimodular transpeptidase-transglycosylase [Carbonactinospora thermoautotrophica]